MGWIFMTFPFWLAARLSPFHCFFYWLPLVLFNIDFSLLRIHKNSQDLKLILDLSVCLVVERLQVSPNVASHLSLGVWESVIGHALWVGRMALLFSLLIEKHYTLQENVTQFAGVNWRQFKKTGRIFMECSVSDYFSEIFSPRLAINGSIKLLEA